MIIISQLGKKFSLPGSFLKKITTVKWVLAYFYLGMQSKK